MKRGVFTLIVLFFGLLEIPVIFASEREDTHWSYNRKGDPVLSDGKSKNLPLPSRRALLSSHNPTPERVEVKAEKVTLADSETLSILRSDLLKGMERRHLKAPEKGLSLTFWVFLASFALLLIGVFGASSSGLFSKISLNNKLYTSHGSLALLAVVLGVISFIYISRMAFFSHEEALFAELDVKAAEMNNAITSFLLHGIKNREYGEKRVSQAKSRISESREIIKELENSENLDPEQASQIAKVSSDLDKFEAFMEEVARDYHEIENGRLELDRMVKDVDGSLQELAEQHKGELDKLARNEEIRYQIKLIALIDAMENASLRLAHSEVGFLLDKNADRIDEMAKQLGLLKGYVHLLEKENRNAREVARLRKTENVINEYEKMLKTIIRDEALIKKDSAEMNRLIAEIESVTANLAHEAEAKVKGLSKESELAAILLITLALVAGVLLSIMIARAISRPINKIVETLSDGTENVSAAAGQVASASQSLAEGATEQAASLEETSSSLEEMSSMVQQNADNAGQAHQLSTAAKDTATKGAHSVRSLINAVSEINKSSEEVSKIIKVIDEIAFQTNLLALNAAVEAARAGEHGKGFAVVAEEVRNLAGRSSEAAKSTAGLIEESTSRAKLGSELASSSGDVLNEIVDNATKTADLIAEIAAASREQAEGIGQVTKAVTQMDQVTQQNSAFSEETASAGEELSSQAEMMKEMVDTLVTLVGGMNAGLATSNFSKIKASHNAAAKISKRETAIATKGVADIAHGILQKDREVKERSSENRGKVLNPADIIPMDQEDFKEF